MFQVYSARTASAHSAWCHVAKAGIGDSSKSARIMLVSLSVSGDPSQKLACSIFFNLPRIIVEERGRNLGIWIAISLTVRVPFLRVPNFIGFGFITVLQIAQ